MIVRAKSYLSDDVGDAAGRRSLNLLWWIPASPVVGFVAAGRSLTRPGRSGR